MSANTNIGVDETSMVGARRRGPKSFYRACTIKRAKAHELAFAAEEFTSLTLAFEAAESINESHNGRDVVIFYIGDLDPAGVLIDISIERELRQHLDPGINLTFERVGITAQQVIEYDLPTKPRKEGERRAPHIERTVEAEAMPAGLMRQLLRERIEALLPTRALKIAKVAEENERAFLKSLAATLGGAT
jgi:hypothetical protein